MVTAGNLDVSVRDRAAYFPTADALVAADLHLGRVLTGPVEFPVPALDSIQTRLTALIDQFNPSDVVFAGDILHSFHQVPPAVTEVIDAIHEYIIDAGRTPVMVSGNHDTLLESITDPVDEYRLEDGTVVCHGDSPPDSQADRYVIGHDHPAIEIEGQRYPCYLYGQNAYEGADVVVLPAFNRHASGTLVNGLSAGDPQSPLLQEIEQYHPIVHTEATDETHTFPSLGNFNDLL